jgi:hypothetical protein
MVSIKIPREIKERLEKLGIKASEVMRKALMEALTKAELDALELEWEKFHPILEKIPIESVIKSIREEREKR